jgi:hypothetical protein
MVPFLIENWRLHWPHFQMRRVETNECRPS